MLFLLDEFVLDIKVQARHYLQIPEDLYNRASATNAAQTATKSHLPEKHAMIQKQNP